MEALGKILEILSILMRFISHNSMHSVWVSFNFFILTTLMQGLQTHKSIAFQVNKKWHVSWLVQTVNSFSIVLCLINLESNKHSVRGDHQK